MMTQDVNVLLVSENEHTIEYLRRHLEANGFRVLASSDGQAALDWLSAQEPALVLLDFIPPSSGTDRAGAAPLDSFQLLRRVRLQSSAGVIVLSRERNEEVKLYFLDSGADDYVPWPCAGGEVVARMRAVMRRVGHRTAA